MHILEVMELSQKRAYLPLLLEADPAEEMIMRYLARGRMFVLERDNTPPRQATLGVIVVVELGGGRCEIKNLAVIPEARGQGYGRLLIEHAAGTCAGRCADLLVGTSEQGVAFYERCGFSRSHIVKDFFVRNYPEPIIENGRACVDMLYLKRTLL